MNNYLDNRQLEKSNYIKNNDILNKISFSDEIINNISIEKLEEILSLINNNKDILNLLSKIYISNTEQLNNILDIFYKDYKYKIFTTLNDTFSTGIIINNINLISYLLNDETYVIYLLNIFKINKYEMITINDINKVFLNNRSLIKSFSYNSDLEYDNIPLVLNLINYISLNKYVNDNLNLNPLTLDDLINYQPYRTKIMIMIILQDEKELIINDIDSLVLGIYATNIEKKIATFLSLSKTFSFKDSLVDFAEQFIYYYNVDNLIEYCKFIEDKKNIVKDIIEEVEQVCTKELVKSFKINLDSNEIHLNGEKFAFLVHKMTGYNNSLLKIKLLDNIKEWNNVTKDSILSTSYINHDFFGTIIGNESILGFYNITSSLILDMGSSDIYSNEKIYMSGEKADLSEFMLPNELIRKSENYNEVVLKREEYEKVIMPDFILSLDSISRRDKSLAHYFKTPIVVLPREIYLDRMDQKLYMLMLNNQLDIMSNYVMQMYFSCGYSEKLLKQYFSTNMMNYRMKEIIEHYKNKINNGNRENIKNSLEDLVDTYLSINNTNYTVGLDTNFAYDTLCKKIRKL